MFRLPIMEALDADRDGTISAAEIERASTALKSLDANKDGELSREELRPMRGRGNRPGEGPPEPADAPRRPGRGERPDRPGRPERPEPPGRPGGDDGQAIRETPPAPKDAAEKKILDVLDDLDRNQRAGMMNVPVEDGRLLRLLAETIGAKHVVEIGTSNGYSGIWQCLALRTTGGKLTTYEIDAGRAGLARENFERAGVAGMVTLIEGDAHEEVTKLKEPIDLLFLDADKEGYLDYLTKLLPQLRPGGLIVAHNMNPRQADPLYVEAITRDPALETLFVHMDRAGVGITLKKR